MSCKLLPMLLHCVQSKLSRIAKAILTILARTRILLWPNLDQATNPEERVRYYDIMLPPLLCHEVGPVDHLEGAMACAISREGVRRGSLGHFMHLLPMSYLLTTNLST